MAIEVLPYESAEFLTSPEAVDEYLRAAFETEDAGFIAEALGTVARAGNMAQLARDTGLTRQALYKALSATGNPEFGTVLKIAHALGFRLEPSRVGTA
jgi:probable addiction module antidote protein